MQSVLLTLHIAGGFSALVGAFVATLSRSVNVAHRWHVYSGRVFFVGMALLFCTAVPLSMMSGNLFLLLIAVFSFYLALAGWAYAKNRSGTPRLLDWGRAVGMLVASVVMVAYGAYLVWGLGSNGGITMLVFAGIGGALSGQDLITIRRGGVTGKDRIARHLTMMLSGAIATITAFLVVNFSVEPGIVLWLAPTAVITPMIVVWSNKVQGGARPKGMPSE